MKKIVSGLKVRLKKDFRIEKERVVHKGSVGKIIGVSAIDGKNATVKFKTKGRDIIVIWVDVNYLEEVK